ncbi:MAG: hypothetical protein AMJ90_05240 [candidate division Zixibacteria bacterium SM23_73_2]|nr:MAG: hypothetical protein AMJ90_05240 [candidate division Zixibacteria bacterium SM23_73_2]
MEYGKLVKRALDIMWKFKYLWIFGFFIQVGSGGGGAGRLSGKIDKIKLPALHVDNFFRSIALEIILLLVLFGLLVFLFFLVLKMISKGGLIHCVWRIETGEKPTLGDGWGVGVKNFWRILCIDILMIILALLAVGVTILPVVLFIIASGVWGVFSAVILIPLFIVILAAILLTELYATRTCIIEGKDVFDSLSSGWDTLKSNLEKSLILALIGIGSIIIYVIGFLIVALMLVVPFIIIGVMNLFWGIAWGIFFGLIYIIIVSGAWGAYIDSFWTLAFLELKKLRPAGGTDLSA